MGILSWVTGKSDGDDDNAAGYTVDQARADGIRGAAADNARDQDYRHGWADTRGGPDAVEDRYRATGPDRDYNSGNRYGMWDNQ